MSKQYITYRNGWHGDLSKLPDAMEAVVADFADRFGAMPASVAVNPAVTGLAQQALAGLSLAASVCPVGGCLLGEIWLEMPGGQRDR